MPFQSQSWLFSLSLKGDGEKIKLHLPFLEVSENKAIIANQFPINLLTHISAMASQYLEIGTALKELWVCSPRGIFFFNKPTNCLFLLRHAHAFCASIMTFYLFIYLHTWPQSDHLKINIFYTERQKKLITSLERRSLKSTPSKLIIFGHR